MEPNLVKKFIHGGLLGKGWNVTFRDIFFLRHVQTSDPWMDSDAYNGSKARKDVLFVLEYLVLTFDLI